MPLTLTSRDKAYVRAVAHGGHHDMYNGKAMSIEGSASIGQMFVGTTHDRYVMLHLDAKPKSQINREWHIFSTNSHELQDIDHDLPDAHKHSINLSMFSFGKLVDKVTSSKDYRYRYGDNCYLESTSLKVRVCLPHDRYNLDEITMGRLIVFRSKEKQSQIEEESMDHANPHYDLFIDHDGYEQGLNGYVDHENAEHYIKSTSHNNYNSTAIQNFLVNKKKYVVMKDCKFNLGKDFGSIGFETSLRWDWNDQCNDIPAFRLDIISGQSGDAVNKNYSWYVVAIGCNPSGATATQLLNVELLGTTHAKSTD